MTNLNRYIGMQLNHGGTVVGARDCGSYIEFRVVIDGDVETHKINKQEAA